MSNTKRKGKRVIDKKSAVRVVCIIMAVLMIVSVLPIGAIVG